MLNHKTRCFIYTYQILLCVLRVSVFQILIMDLTPVPQTGALHHKDHIA